MFCGIFGIKPAFLVYFYHSFYTTSSPPIHPVIVIYMPTKRGSFSSPKNYQYFCAFYTIFGSFFLHPLFSIFFIFSFPFPRPSLPKQAFFPFFLSIIIYLYIFVIFFHYADSFFFQSFKASPFPSASRQFLRVFQFQAPLRSRSDSENKQPSSPRT